MPLPGRIAYCPYAYTAYGYPGCSLTERHSDQTDESYEKGSHEEVRELWVQAHNVVHDGREQYGQHQEYRYLGEGLAQEVHVRPVHAVVVFAHEHRKFGTEHLWRYKK